jgi:hypothetical protein
MRLITSKHRKAIGEFFDHARDTAQLNFARDACCAPVALLLRDDEETAVLPLGKLINHKDAASVILNKLIEATHPLAFAFVTEAWMAVAARDAQTGDVVDDVRKKYQGHLTERIAGGKEKPKAGVKEVVMLLCSSVTGENFMLTADILRAEGVKPGLKPWERAENTHAEGRFIFDVTPLTERQ